MSPERPKDIAASVRGRLLNLARANGEEYSLTLQRYANERYLYRLSRSRYQAAFILKGGMLLPALGADIYRPTRDIDLLGSGQPEVDRLRAVFVEITETVVDADGMTFDATAIVVEPIRAVLAYGGVQVLIPARLGSAITPIRIDVGIGDAVTPDPIEADYPTLLPMRAPTLRMYPIETVISEKFEALVRFGLANGRLKDYYDLWIIATKREVAGATLTEAFANTFSRRTTPLPQATPVGLTDAFLGDPTRQRPWQRFLGSTPDAPDLAGLSVVLIAFLMPPATAAATGKTLDRIWTPGIGWR